MEVQAYAQVDIYVLARKHGAGMRESLAWLQEEAGEERERDFGRESGEIPGPYTQDQANGRSGYLRAGRFSTHFEVLRRRWHVSYTC